MLCFYVSYGKGKGRFRTAFLGKLGFCLGLG